MKLDPEKVKAELSNMPGWELNGNSLVKTFRFKDFSSSVEFLAMIRPIADSLNHHPDVCINYDKVKVELTTHDEGGVTEKDIYLAKRIQGVYDALFADELNS
ncbi:MAG: 4a-hydroxytetrahydrobiopterin dehydratase [Thermoprotei archaeon]